MSRNRAVILFFVLGLAPGARASSDAATTISAPGNALTNAKTAESLSAVMPSGPPALSQSGAPEVQPDASRTAPPADAAPPRAALPSTTPESPPPAPIGAFRSAPDDAIVVRRSEAVPQAVVPAREAPRSDAWWWILGIGAAAFVLGYSIH